MAKFTFDLKCPVGVDAQAAAKAIFGDISIGPGVSDSKDGVIIYVEPEIDKFKDKAKKEAEDFVDRLETVYVLRLDGDERAKMVNAIAKESAIRMRNEEIQNNNECFYRLQKEFIRVDRR